MPNAFHSHRQELWAEPKYVKEVGETRVKPSFQADRQGDSENKSKSLKHTYMEEWRLLGCYTVWLL
jgi:hypothetical protein